MAIIRKVLGPFSPEAVHPGTKDAELRWYFVGIRGDQTTAHWALIFKAEDRKFTVSTSQLGSAWRGNSMARASRELGDAYPSVVVHPDAFLDGSPVEEGRVVDILRKRLNPEDFAKATALAIARR
ncbi:hypothetical protein J2X65_003525 [Ancylobacter sp. 3268]|uniref:hypothetical protein n=1 Tax=Ancylobacter sp. 3268 TaxID=2817752 RepID=UPI00285DDED8|nr:hypothetical protein [Ancylobacter sp. 3268]MDR6954157.1 hypothetical protein [Ancylobacter sp. 3268]